MWMNTRYILSKTEGGFFEDFERFSLLTNETDDGKLFSPPKN